MKLHTLKGCEILDKIEGIWDEEYKEMSYEICRHHHERYDGRGYPDRLKGEEIPISAQIVSVADVYDALVSKRCYKESMSFEEAEKVMLESMGSHFDPNLKQVFVLSKQRLEEYYKQA
jgi:putative two-component system response regulator